MTVPLDTVAIILTSWVGFGFILFARRDWHLLVGGLLVLAATGLFAARY